MFINRQKNLDKQKVEIQHRTASMENYFQSPNFVNQARLEVEKDKRVEMMEKRYLQVSEQRDKERIDKLRQRNKVIKTETEDANAITLTKHRAAKQMALIKKYQDGLFHNRATTLSPKPIPSNIKVKTGLKSLQPGGISTER